MDALKPYRKAIVAAVLAAVICAAQYYQVPWVQIAAAAATPFAVYFAKNDPL